ncbi:GNAT family N-acetyltransferase [Providencia vermicola]|uniref:GNAT family N-acetyltransferase n=2 Tax=Providencia TaxID=586 RepID=A0AAI9MWH7_PROST|nr:MULTISPECIES: GNAT family N-acetyltransferase [Providencia]ELR5045267.1 GNAT family N-acetyltransferase [Providencia rettgeri]ELR5035427.1 GNAT family N-acetyltransferase [Providencia stuartii]ELR5119958.1 GNAT family N-acetyltransferase [Providencia stuartii]ELR5141714.1 GNAT family N-acetyltransferase [Providencia stuartii]ELR5291067.1 GNAT family N-acetyltransferase [Providencia stuartii]
MILHTERLILRPWQENDAADLYEYAKDERVGPIAGWPPHQSVEESLDIIKNIFMRDEIYAVALKEDNRAIGLIGLSIGSESNFPIGENDAEVSYWIGVPFWGKGLIPEAIREVMRHGFNDLKLDNLWCGYFQGNEQSKIAQEKCGFVHYGTLEPQYIELIGEIKVEELSRITYDEWKNLN